MEQLLTSVVCFGEAHSCTNLFHAAEIWEVNSIVVLLQYWIANFITLSLLQDSMFKPVVIGNRVINVLPEHTCSTKKTIDVCCIDANGKGDT